MVEIKIAINYFMKKLSGILFLFLILATGGFSQQFVFSNYSINNGLSQSVVNCLFQDSKGFIWIGTQNGLNRFNGETFDVFSYSPSDSNSISDNWIYAIAEDSSGDLWIGTKGGLNRYLRTQNKFERISYQTSFNFDVSQYCYDVLKLKNGNILINTPPLISIFDFGKNEFTHFQSQLDYDGAVKDVKIPVLEDSEGEIWIGTTTGIARFSEQTNAFSYFSFFDRKGTKPVNASITALFTDKNGVVRAGTDSGLYWFNTETSQFCESEFKTADGGVFVLENVCIRTINGDKNGNLIIGTEGRGLFVISPFSKNTFTIQNYTSENSEIGHNIVQSLIIDWSENLWIGTLQGISKTDLKKKKFNLYRKSNSPNSIDLLGNVIASLFKNDDGILWVGNWGQGLNLVRRNTREVEHFSSRQNGNHFIPNDFIHSIFKDNDNSIWLGTRDGILIYDKTANRFVQWNSYFNNTDIPSFDNVRVNVIIRDKTSNYWIGTQNGLYLVSSDKKSVTAFQEELDENHRLSANLVYCLLEDSDGLIWIATVGGLDMYNPATKKITHYNKGKGGLSDDFIITLCEDGKNRIWIGTATFVNVFDKTDSTFTFYGQEHGIPNNRIFEIVKDKNNNLWITTGKGLCKYDEKENSFQTFTSEDGLQGLEFNLRAARVCDDGEVLIGGMNGFNTFYPDSISKNPHIPPLVFTSFYKTRGNNREYINPGESDVVKLKHNVNSFTIEFAALEYTNPAKNRYSYLMEGISPDWIDIGNRKFVPFSGLQPGEYTFKVRGSNNDGVWNNNEISINIIVLPPWWKSSLAYLFYFVFIVFSIIVFVKIRERKLLHDKETLQQKIHERTLQIEEKNRLIVSKNDELKALNNTKDKLFSIIGHDLGNQFNIILGFLEVLVSDFKRLDPVKVENHLNNINKSSKHAYELLENLLTWSRMQTKSIHYNPEVFNINSKISRSVELLDGAFSKKNISVEVISKENIDVFADVNMFMLVIRNLVSNAIKFTGEDGKISILIERENEFCRVTVQDNGVGISPELIQRLFLLETNHSTPGTKGEKGTGLGLILCKEFIEKHNGKLWVESEVGKGSRFIFTLPLNMQN